MKRTFEVIWAAILAATLVGGSRSGCSSNGGSESPDNSWEIGGRWRYSTQSIWGDVLVAGEYVGDSGLQAMYITAYDLRTREKKRLKEIPLDCRFEAPSVSGVWVVWAQYNYSDEFKGSANTDFYS